MEPGESARGTQWQSSSSEERQTAARGTKWQSSSGEERQTAASKRSPREASLLLRALLKAGPTQTR